MEKVKFGLVLILMLSLFQNLQAQEKRISINFRNEPMSTALQKVATQGNLRINFNHEDVTSYKVNASISNKTVTEILNMILKGTPLLYQVQGQFITVFLNPKSPAAKARKKNFSVEGTVYDDGGSILPGASVIVTYSTQSWGGTTDLNGAFVINIPVEIAEKEGVFVQVSFVGFKKEKRQVTQKRKNYKFVLSSDTQEVQEVVVTGFGNLDSRKKTSAITSLKMEDILMPGMTSIDQALEGRVPDMIFMQNSGEVGSTARMRIRGTSTLVGNREPLWVLDGIPLTDPVDVTTEQLNDPDYINYIGNAISGINPQDIERIDILKDAAATALYGTRAANGVIVVTTKKGHVGPPSISYSTQMKLVRRPRYTDHNINLMNSQERVQFGKDLCDLHYAFPSNMSMVGYEGAYQNYISGQIDREEFLNQVRNFETVNTDWFKILSRDALTQSHTISLSGGSDKTRYYASLGYTGEDAVVRTQYNNRYTASMNLQTSFTESLQANIRLNGNVQKKNYLPDEIKALNYAYETTRALPCYNPDGSLYYYKRHAYNIGTGKGDSYKYNYNILNEMENSSQTYNANSIIAAFDLKYRYEHIFDFSLSSAYQRSSSTSETWFGEKTNYVAQLKNGEEGDAPLEGTAGKCDLPYGGVLNSSNSISEDFTVRLQANYHQSFGKKNMHLVSAILGYEVNTNRNNGYSDKTRGYFKDRGMKYVNSMTAEDIAKFPEYANWLAKNHRTMTANKTNKLSGYLTASYSYGDYFTINVNGRFDASNKFGSRSNEKFLPVWSVSGMFNIKETFCKDFTVADDMRFRFSYGKTGNMVDGQTPNLLINQGSVDSYFGEYYSTVSAFPNPNLRWEQTDQVNFGLDLSFFNRRLMFGTDIYYKKTKDAFTSVSVPTTNGVSTFMMNGGDITNFGYSFSLSGYPIQTRDWSWYLSTSYSYVKNKVGDNIINEYTIDDYLNGTAIIGGEPIGTFYSYKFMGLDPENGAPLFDDYVDRRHLLENKSLEDVVKMVMVNSGSREPKFTGSLYSTVKWKQLSLSTNFTYSLGSKIRKFALYSEIQNGVSSENNVRKEFVDRWKVPGDEHRTNYPALISPSDPMFVNYRNHWSTQVSADIQGFKPFASDIWNMYDTSDIRVVSGNYLRLSQLTLRYQFPAKMLKRTPISNLAIDFSTSNVFTICSGKLDGQDPSQGGFSATTVLSARPSYTMGVRVTF